jgi:hypothetical protein
MMLRIPNVAPIPTGKTNSSTLRSLSTANDKPEREDSNTVRKIRNPTDDRNKAMDFAPSVNFTEVLHGKLRCYV